MDDFPSLFIPIAFHPEIRIDQQQGFHGQVLQFQIPYRMVGGDVPHLGTPSRSQNTSV